MIAVEEADVDLAANLAINLARAVQARTPSLKKHHPVLFKTLTMMMGENDTTVLFNLKTWVCVCAFNLKTWV